MSNRPRGESLAVVEREHKMVEAYNMSLRGMKHTEIAKVLGVHRNTVRALIRDEEANRQIDRGDAAEKALGTYEEAIREAWDRLQDPNLSGYSAAALLQVIIQAQDKADAITGVKAPRKALKKVDSLMHLDLSGLSDKALDILGQALEETVEAGLPSGN